MIPKDQIGKKAAFLNEMPLAFQKLHKITPTIIMIYNHNSILLLLFITLT